MSLAAVWAYPAIDPVALRIGSLAIRWYGLAYLAAFLFAWWLVRRLNERWGLGMDADQQASLILAAVIGVVIGARLGYVIFYGAGEYWRTPAKILAIWDGGMSFHGGLAGALVAGAYMARGLKIPFLRLADLGAVAAPLGFGLGRLANFANDELWGRVTSVPWGMVFPNGGPQPRHPSQLYEAALEGAVLLTVMLLLSTKKRSEGEVTGWMLTLYAVFRILAEFFRQPDVQIGLLPGGVTMGQILSVPVLLAGIWLLWRSRRAGRAEGSTEAS